MSATLLADVVMVVHWLLIIAVFAGIALGIKIRWFRPIEATVLLIAVVLWSLYGGCPLTFIEQHLRVMAGTPIPLASVGFIPYYLGQWFAISVSSHTINIITYGLVGIFLLLSFEWEFSYIRRRWFKK
jgi:hypothetical protein